MTKAEYINKFEKAERKASECERRGDAEGMKRWEKIAAYYLKQAEKKHNQ